MKKVLIIIAVLMGLMPLNIRASHFAGAELTYLCMGGATYKITLSFYRDCSGINAPNNANIHLECSSSPNFNFNTIINQVSGSGAEITNVCSSAATSCTNGSAYGIKKYVYEGFVTLPPCDEWTLYYDGGARNPITTLVSTGNWYIPASFNNSIVANNSAPVYNNQMIPIVNINELVTLDYGAIDPDGDSLVYSLYAPYTSGPSSVTSVIYSNGYSGTNFLNSSTPITLDPATGIVQFTPTSVLNTVIGIKVEQYRNINGVDAIIATTYRDFTIKVVGGGNHTPTLSGMDFSNSHTYNINDTIYEYNACSNQILEFDINGFDADTFNSSNSGNPEKYNISWNNGIAGATFNVINNNSSSAYAHFSWTPTDADTASQKCFFVSVVDQACPYYSSTKKKYCFNIKGGEGVNLNISSAAICSDSSVTLVAQTAASNPTYVWRWNGVIINTPQNSNTYTYVGTSFLPGVDTISVNIPSQNPNSCQAYDYSVISLAYQPTIHNKFSDTAFCVNDSILFDAEAGGANYIWKNGFGTVIGNSRYMTLSQIGLYSVYVDGGNNSQCFDADTFLLLSETAPNVNLGNDTTLEPYQYLTLSALPGHNYLWSTGETSQSIVIKPNEIGLGNMQLWLQVYDLGCPGTDTLNLTFITNIEEYNYVDANLSVFPNPNVGVFTLEINDELAQKLHLTIFNSVGKFIYSENFETNGNSPKRIDLSSLSSGIYFMRIETDSKNVYRSKIVIKK